jgi:hypothetical protein
MAVAAAAQGASSALIENKLFLPVGAAVTGAEKLGLAIIGSADIAAISRAGSDDWPLKLRLRWDREKAVRKVLSGSTSVTAARPWTASPIWVSAAAMTSAPAARAEAA